ncbi:MAG: serine/threonine-protein kinase [Lysobacteraceae bacterium]
MNGELDALIDRLSGGEIIDPDSLPDSLRSHPQVQALLKLSRVLGQLDANQQATDTPRSHAEPIGPFRLTRLLGIGGMGEVWLGERNDGDIAQQVAIKRVRLDAPAFEQRLRAERRILARLSHPGIARFIDAGLDPQGSPWLAMEYIDGISLSDWASTRNPGLTERLQLFQQICHAVHAAHQQLVIHRDLKPANVLVDAQGQAHLLDFGIAKLMDDTQREATVTSLTPAYAAPEQLLGEPVGTATDVFALGLLLMQLLSGRLPDERASLALPQLVLRAHTPIQQRASDLAAQQDLPYPAHTLRGDLDAIVAQAIRIEPESRYASALALAEDIERFLQAHPVRARRPDWRYRATRFIRRHRLPVVAGITAVLGLLIGTGVAIHQATLARQSASLAQRELQRAERINDLLTAVLREHDPLQRSGATARTPGEGIDAALQAVRLDAGLDSDSQLRLLTVLAEAKLNLGDIPGSRAVLEEAGKLAEQENVNTVLHARWWAAHAAVALRALQTDSALDHYTKALALLQSMPGRDSADFALIEREQAQALVTAGRFPEALAAAQHAAKVLQAAGPAQAMAAAVAEFRVGMIQEQTRDDTAALATFARARTAIEAVAGSDDARLAQVLSAQGLVQLRLRDFDAAATSFQKGLEIARKQLGERHTQTATLWTRLSTLHREKGDLDAAISALDAAQKALPEGDINALAQVHASRGAIQLMRGNAEAAERDLHEAMQLRKAQSNAPPGLAWFSQSEWGNALAALGRLDEAERVQTEAAQELRTQLGADAFQNSLLLARLAQTQRLRKHWDAAAAALREAIRVVDLRADALFPAFQYRLQLADVLKERPADRDELEALVTDLLKRCEQPPLRDQCEAVRALRN